MNYKVISSGKKKAEIIIIEDTTYGKVYTTRHLEIKGGRWQDKKGKIYKI